MSWAAPQHWVCWTWQGCCSSVSIKEVKANRKETQGKQPKNTERISSLRWSWSGVLSSWIQLPENYICLVLSPLSRRMGYGKIHGWKMKEKNATNNINLRLITGFLCALFHCYWQYENPMGIIFTRTHVRYTMHTDIIDLICDHVMNLDYSGMPLPVSLNCQTQVLI